MDTRLTRGNIIESTILHPHFKLIDEIGEDNITYESDYPHSDSTWPLTKQIAEQQMANLTEEQRWKVLRGNAIKLFSLDLPA